MELGARREVAEHDARVAADRHRLPERGLLREVCEEHERPVRGQLVAALDLRQLSQGDREQVRERPALAGGPLLAVRRGAYDDMAPYWPSSTDIYAAPMNEIPKVVFSSTLTDPAWGETRVVAGEPATEIAALKAEAGKPILLHGGASFARSLAGLGLIDEYRLLVHPVALGEGLPLFGARTRLRLRDSRIFSTGVVASTLVPA